MRRRDFIAGLATGTAAWPLATGAQQPMPVVGFLSGARLEYLTPSAPLGAALPDGLTELGFVEGKNFVFESRWANGEFERLPRADAWARIRFFGRRRSQQRRRDR